MTEFSNLNDILSKQNVLFCKWCLRRLSLLGHSCIVLSLSKTKCFRGTTTHPHFLQSVKYLLNFLWNEHNVVVSLTSVRLKGHYKPVTFCGKFRTKCQLLPTWFLFNWLVLQKKLFRIQTLCSNDLVVGPPNSLYSLRSQGITLTFTTHASSLPKDLLRLNYFPACHLNQCQVCCLLQRHCFGPIITFALMTAELPGEQGCWYGFGYIWASHMQPGNLLSRTAALCSLEAIWGMRDMGHYYWPSRRDEPSVGKRLSPN